MLIFNIVWVTQGNKSLFSRSITCCTYEKCINFNLEFIKGRMHLIHTYDIWNKTTILELIGQST